MCRSWCSDRDRCGLRGIQPWRVSLGDDSLSLRPSPRTAGRCASAERTRSRASCPAESGGTLCDHERGCRRSSPRDQPSDRRNRTGDRTRRPSLDRPSPRTFPARDDSTRRTLSRRATPRIRCDRRPDRPHARLRIRRLAPRSAGRVCSRLDDRTLLVTAAEPASARPARAAATSVSLRGAASRLLELRSRAALAAACASCRTAPA